MALVKSSERSTAEYLDLKELAGEAVVMTVREIEDETDLGNGPLRPVRARVIVLTGPRKGEVHENERILPAGIRSKLTAVGDDVVGRLALYGKRNAVGLNNEAAGDVELALAALEQVNGGGVPAQAGPPAAERKAPAKKAAAASVLGDADADDDEPSF